MNNNIDDIEVEEDEGVTSELVETIILERNIFEKVIYGFQKYLIFPFLIGCSGTVGIYSGIVLITLLINKYDVKLIE
eukprot:TRINITY_DN107175_c0_g1_i1.p1 TRINITY_DN107175_c0_g1~~TRINITY_DN107175_c0_g1_i1.p1  ORF type:complete len:77 (-),score=13.91 TRINITY_DN107175_c0_g1_i1:30-260(-)